MEKALFLSIASHSIRDPLQAIREPESDSYILLDGFKRLRCCLKLAISQIPAICLRTSEVDGICTLLRQKTSTSLTIFEQACLVDTLYTQYSLDLPEIASRLGRSRSWVSLRFHLMDEMSDIIRDKIVSGLFPVRVYMYGLRKFTRVKSELAQVERFVTEVSGNGLSTRDIQL
ncbi:MAG: ParB N-terminal domain-containing protein, partial [candidate division Zixibacteria bacterium]|nr:ParB N-terminal domain-containing protein [candidate division Zixibacteria bacterium]